MKAQKTSEGASARENIQKSRVTFRRAVLGGGGGQVVAFSRASRGDLWGSMAVEGEAGVKACRKKRQEASWLEPRGAEGRAAGQGRDHAGPGSLSRLWFL